MTLDPTRRLFAIIFVAFSIFVPASSAGQSPYQAQDPVVTVVPGQIVGAPISPSEDASEYKRLRCHYSISPKPAEKFGADCETGKESERAHSLVNSLLQQWAATPGGPASANNLLDRTLLNDIKGQNGSSESASKQKPAILLHIAVWHVTPNQLTDGRLPRVFTLMHSEWHGFTAACEGETEAQATCTLAESERPDGSPSFYDTGRIYFIAINEFDSQMFGSRVSVDYKLYELPQEPANLVDLSTALSAISGVQIAAPQSSNAVLSPPLAIDTGTAYHGSDNATVMINLYQAVLPDNRHGPYPIPRTSRAPYSLNANFFLQFQPSPLSISQGQKLAAPAQNSSGQGSQGGAQDTSLYLKDHLESLYPNSRATSFCPLPPGLVFRTDLELALLNYLPDAQLIPVDEPSHCVSKLTLVPGALTKHLGTLNTAAKEHLASLLVAAALEKAEQSILLASEQAYTSFQLVPDLAANTQIKADAIGGLINADEMPLGRLLQGSVPSTGSGALRGAITAEFSYQTMFNEISAAAATEQGQADAAVAQTTEDAKAALAALYAARGALRAC